MIIKHRVTDEVMVGPWGGLPTLAGATLRGADLRGADLRDANLTRANLTAADLAGADLTDANLTGATLRDADLTGADLRGADLRGASLTDASLMGATLRGATLRDADLAGANLTGANLRDADLVGANLTGATLTGANLREADLAGADLTRADLRGAYLLGANLRGADLRGANLAGADLTAADLAGADLRGATLTRANLRGATRTAEDAAIPGWRRTNDTDKLVVGCDACDTPMSPCPLCGECQGGCGACECLRCDDCTSTTSSVCSRCDNCEDCCECAHCGTCGPVESTCDACQECSDHHCACAHCATCGEVTDPYELCRGVLDDDGEVARDCESCEACCRCERHDGAFNPPAARRRAAGAAGAITSPFRTHPATSPKVRRRFRCPRLAGVEVEYVSANGAHEHITANAHVWGGQVHRDGSCGWESVTAPAAGDVLLAQLADTAMALAADGATCDDTCGVHVHVDARDLTWSALARLLLVWERVEPLAYVLSGTDRLGNRYCRPWDGEFTAALGRIPGGPIGGPATKDAILGCFYDSAGRAARERLKAAGKRRARLERKTYEIRTNRYRSLNIMPWLARIQPGNKAGEHKVVSDATVEFRCHEGTHDAHELQQWAMLCTRIVQWAIDASDRDLAALPRSAARALSTIAPECAAWVLQSVKTYRREVKRSSRKVRYWPEGPGWRISSGVAIERAWRGTLPLPFDARGSVTCAV